MSLLFEFIWCSKSEVRSLRRRLLKIGICEEELFIVVSKKESDEWMNEVEERLRE